MARRVDPAQLQLPREHDLPPRWDGDAVLWEPWRDELEITMCPPPRSPERCSDCGSTKAPTNTFGRIWFGVDDPAGGPPRRPPDKMLSLSRCRDCQGDTVFDGFGPNAQAWRLDPSDYGDNGSWEVSA